MENKYYTPSIDEFYVGFQYEVYDRLHKTWNKENNFFLQQGNFNDEIRVKYLSKEDIESLGFVLKKEIVKENEFLMSFYLKKEFCYELKFSNIKDTFNISIEASLGINDREWWGVFMGDIRNKSELRRILTMVGVI